jgi:hypothetical protein
MTMGKVSQDPFTKTCNFSTFSDSFFRKKQDSAKLMSIAILNITQMSGLPIFMSRETNNAKKIPGIKNIFPM